MTLAQRRMVELCSVDLPPGLGEDLVRETAAGVLDWREVMAVAGANRTLPFLHAAVRRLGVGDRLPVSLVTALRQQFLRNHQRNLALEKEVTDLLAALQQSGPAAIVLRGVVLSAEIFANPALRTIKDIDVLVRREDLRPFKEVVRRLGYGPDPRLLADAYYERHHLHIPYRQRESGALLEIHWAFDHPFTPYNVDIGAVFRDARRGEFGGFPALLLSPEDLLVMLCLHAFKHASSVKYSRERTEALRQVLEEEGFAQFLDLRYAVEWCRGRIDWDRFQARATDWNLQVPVLATLRAMELFFHRDPKAQVPEVPGRPPVRHLERLFFDLLSGIVGRRSVRRGGPGGHQSSATLRYRLINGLTRRFYFNAIRLLDIFAFIFPSSGFLRARYGYWPLPLLPLPYLGHLLLFICRILWNITDMALFSLRKKFRPA